MLVLETIGDAAYERRDADAGDITLTCAIDYLDFRRQLTGATTPRSFRAGWRVLPAVPGYAETAARLTPARYLHDEVERHRHRDAGDDRRHENRRGAAPDIAAVIVRQDGRSPPPAAGRSAPPDPQRIDARQCQEEHRHQRMNDKPCHRDGGQFAGGLFQRLAVDCRPEGEEGHGRAASATSRGYWP